MTAHLLCGETACEPCAEFQRGERENLKMWGVTVHVCSRKREDGQYGFDQCRCGCAQDERTKSVDAR